MFPIQSAYAAFLSKPRGCPVARQTRITYVERVARRKSRRTIGIDRQVDSTVTSSAPGTFHMRRALNSATGTPYSFVTVFAAIRRRSSATRSTTYDLRRGLKSNLTSARGDGSILAYMKFTNRGWIIWWLIFLFFHGLVLFWNGENVTEYVAIQWEIIIMFEIKRNYLVLLIFVIIITVGISIII